MSDLPSGTVTFLFTDIEGSTRLWEQSPEAMGVALRHHDALLASRVSEHGGHLFASTGDGIAAAFDRVEHALAAAVAIQRSPGDEGTVSFRIRMVINTGEAEERSGNYFGPVLNETARLLGSGHGGQILVAGVSQQILGSRLPDGLVLRDMGEHRLRDIARPIRVFQAVGPGLPDGFPPLRGSDSGRPLLPAPLTELVGRDQDLRALTKALSDHRLVTLVGAGGCGKTRLALEVARQHEELSREPAWFVELAPVAEPSLVAETLGAMIGATSAQESGDLNPIISLLRSSSGLILLDNCEHLVAEASRVVAAVLRECPLIRVLATSREPLSLQGEVVYPVQPLRTPPQDASAADLLAFDSVRLFEARAADSRPGFAVDATNAAAVNRICRRLDGIPLGLELAAARLRALPLDEIARRLDASLAVLGTAGRDVVPHHRTLEATLEWSYELLAPPERELLSYLAVFAGGWTLEAMEAVWPGDAGLDLLVALVEKSLVSVADDATPPRYRLLEPIRQYARGKLAVGGSEPVARDRHAHYFAELTERAFLEMWGPHEPEWLDRLDVEIDNLREGLTWHIEAGTGRAGQAMAGALVFLWSRTSRLSEAITWQQRVLARSSEPGSARARALLLSNLHILEDAKYHHELLAEAVTLYREHGPDRELALALLFDASHTAATGEWQAAMTECEEALHIAEAIGHDGILAVAASELASLSAVWAGDLERAIPLATRAVEAARRCGSRHTLHGALAGAADLEEARGALETAEMLLTEALGIEGEGRWAGTPGLALARLAEIALTEGRLDLAMVRLDQQHRQIVEVIDYGEMWAQGQALRDQLRIRGDLEVRRGRHARGVTLLSAYLAVRGVTRVDEARQSRVDAALASAAQVMGEAEYAVAWERGRSMTMRSAAEYVWDDPIATR